MASFETNNQYLCSKSRRRKTSVRVELLDLNYTIIDHLEGNIIDGSLTLSNGNGFSRIAGSLDMTLNKTLSKDYFKINLKHLVRVIMIIKDKTKNISAEYIIGICLLNSPTITRGVDGNQKISIDLNDLFSNYNGDFSGDLENTVTIEASGISGASLSKTIQDIALDSELMGLSIDRIKIEPNDLQILSDITCEKGGKITDLLQSLLDLYPGYELFFDRDGILTYQKIKSYKTDSPIQELINSSVVISYSPKNNFTNVRNYIKIWGSSNTDNSDTTTQYSAIAQLTDTNHPLSIPNFGKKVKVIVNETDQSNQACQSEADFWLSQYTNYAQTIEISMLPDYRLVPNKVIVIEYSDKVMNIENARYLINSVVFGLKSSDLSTLSVSKLYT